MAFQIYKSELPSSSLGANRCFQINYFGQGDIFTASWQGSIDQDPKVDGENATCFNLIHGSDVIIMASFAGYLKHAGRTRGDIKKELSKAGANILKDATSKNSNEQTTNTWYTSYVADGGSFPLYDLADSNLRCLAVPIPTRPGTIDNVGGTALYTRSDLSNGETYVMANITRTNQIAQIADFCAADIPVLARQVCQMAMGEYRNDIQHFLTNLYADSE